MAETIQKGGVYVTFLVGPGGDPLVEFHADGARLGYEEASELFVDALHELWVRIHKATVARMVKQ